MTNIRKTLEQERASFCLEKVKEITTDKKKFKSHARSLPSFIVSNGLIPTLAFYKSKEERKRVYEVINEWLIKKKYVSNDALEELVNADFQKLRLATTEALAIANWLERIVEVEIEE
jgi:CRISPR-associated protein Cmr5